MPAIFYFHLIITVFGYFILAFSYSGIGWLGLKILRIDFLPENGVFYFIWVGWASTLFLLQILHLFFPINFYVSLPILILGLICAGRHLKSEFINSIRFPLSKIYLLLMAGVSVFIAALSMQSPTVYDSGLYHFNSIRWLNEYPIVLGLGNLHGRLAFNQSFFAYVAYLNLYPVFNHGHNLANSFLLLTLIAETLMIFLKSISRPTSNDNCLSVQIAAILLLPVLFYMVIYFNISSPTPDIASTILQILIFIYFIRAIDHQSTHTNILQVFVIGVLSATLITIKLSNLFYVVSLCALLSFTVFRTIKLSSKQGIKLIAFPVFILFIWSLRGIFLSGCPVYPSTFGCIQTNWSVPIESVKDEANWIYSWARLPHETPEKVLNSWHWLKPWFFRVILMS